MSDMLLRVRNIGWRAGETPILDRVSFEVAPGEFVAVMGRNGAGKSTLLDIVAGLRRPSEGAIVIGDVPLDEMRPRDRARVMAHLPQHLRADLAMHAESLVMMGRYAHAGRWFETTEDAAIARQAMERCECLEFRRRTLATLSGGERQRVLLAACLAQQPRLLLLDEPATFLDVDQQLQCFNTLREEADRGVACVAVTHDVNLALTFCTRLIVLSDRTVARDLPASTALESPEWLRMFSQRLDVAGVREGRPWVRYQ